MRLTACFIVFILTTANETPGTIIYVNESATWDEARSNCTYTYNGRLASLTEVEENKDDVESCVPRNVDVWTGEYYRFSPWIIAMGCYNVSYDSFHLLDYPSVFNCQRRCPKSNLIAIKENECVCSAFTLLSTFHPLAATECSIRCDVMAFCGGPRGHSVYHRGNLLNVDKAADDLRCVSTSGCNGNQFEFKLVNCSEERPFICGDHRLTGLSTYHESVNWTTAMDLCIARNDTVLANRRFCDFQTHDRLHFWVGGFRLEGFLQDQGLDCYYTDNGVDYQGNVNITYDGYECAHWSLEPTYANLEKNYCRNPNGRMSPWCLFCPDDCEKRRCNVTKCDTPVQVFMARQNRNGSIESTSVRYSDLSEAPYLCKTERAVLVDSDTVVCSFSIASTGQSGDVVANGNLKSNVKQNFALIIVIGVIIGLIITIAVAAVLKRRRSSTTEHSRRSVTLITQTKIDDNLKDFVIQRRSTRRDDSGDSTYCEIRDSSFNEIGEGLAMVNRDNQDVKKIFNLESADSMALGKRRYVMLQIPFADSDDHIYTIAGACEGYGRREITDDVLREGVNTCTTGEQDNNDSHSEPDQKKAAGEGYTSKYYVLESVSSSNSETIPKRSELVSSSSNVNDKHTYIEIIEDEKKLEVTGTGSSWSMEKGQTKNDNIEDGYSTKTDSANSQCNETKNALSNSGGGDNINVSTQAIEDEYDHLHTTNQRHIMTSSTAARLNDNDEHLYDKISETNHDSVRTNEQDAFVPDDIVHL